MKALAVLLILVGFFATLVLRDAGPLLAACGLCAVVVWVVDAATARRRRETYERLRAELGAGPSGL